MWMVDAGFTKTYTFVVLPHHLHFLEFEGMCVAIRLRTLKHVGTTHIHCSYIHTQLDIKNTIKCLILESWPQMIGFCLKL